jgi:hypothetical protein
MASGILASLIGVLALGFIEGVRRFYPTHATWMKLRRVNGRRAVRAMRKRFEAMAAHRTTRLLALTVVLLVPAVWIGSISLLHSRWYEALIDVSPYAFVAVALLRTPGALRSVAARIKEYEKNAGDDTEDEDDRGDDGPAEIAL